MVMAFFITLNLIWWVNHTRRLARVLDGQLLAIVVTHVPVSVVLWFTGVVGVLVLPGTVAIWLLWRRHPRWGLGLAAVAVIIASGVARWGAEFFPLVSGPGGSYIRSLPFGGP